MCFYKTTIHTDKETNIIMFEDLSTEVKEKMLQCRQIDNRTKENWKIAPVAYTDKSLTKQSEVDREVLLQIGYF